MHKHNFYFVATDNWVHANTCVLFYEKYSYFEWSGKTNSATKLAEVVKQEIMILHRFIEDIFKIHRKVEASTGSLGQSLSLFFIIM